MAVDLFHDFLFLLEAQNLNVFRLKFRQDFT